MSAFEVIWHKDWQDRPILARSDCHHECGEQLSINQRLEPAGRGRGGYKIALNGIVCMDCGTDTTDHFTVAEALHLCMEQHGWNRHVGERLHDLAATHKDELIQSPAIPIWGLYAFGMSGREVHEALNNGTLKPARMSEEVDQLAETVSEWKRPAA